MRLILITIFLLSLTIFSANAADNVFRPKNTSNIEQSNQFIPKPLMPLVQKIRQLQAQYLNQVTETLRQIKQDEKSLFPLSLLFLSFLYGLLHAAGPGHGKAVISAYLLSTKAQLHQGIQIAFFASMLQAVTAIIITFSGIFLLQFSVRSINQSFTYFEQFSYALIATLGLYLLIAHIIKIIRRNPTSGHHIHDENCDCDHDHMPAPQPNQNLKQKLLTIFSIGIRPCTGALIILILAHSLQLYGTAILATFLMAFGTFITISLVATFAVSLQNISQKFTGNMSSKYYTYAADTLKIGLYLFILSFGILLIIATI